MLSFISLFCPTVRSLISATQYMLLLGVQKVSLLIQKALLRISMIPYPFILKYIFLIVNNTSINIMQINASD